MTPYLADWLGIAFIFGALSFLAGWVACNVSWRRWQERKLEPVQDVVDALDLRRLGR